ncbi:ribonuclease III [Thalassospiraceae bacterium LMO-JJ14]|nr:ribonuclease III [Thalassospiraceae bacterium LMO-JJ14]
MSAALDTLQAAIGYTFRDIGLLRHALVHSSAASVRLKSNERMEFLGDRVLGLVLADMLLDAYPDEEEGEISYRFTALAQRDALANVAAEIGIADHLSLSNGEHLTGGRENPGMLADATEAVICAIYQDGGLEAARKFILTFWAPMMRENRRPPKDPKTTLQEWAQGRGLGLPTYRITAQEGPDHQPVFTVEVSLQGQKSANGEGANKRAAEQAAAEAMLAAIEKDNS